MAWKQFSFFTGVMVTLLLLARTVAADPPPIQRPGVYQGNEAISGWLMSEKYDGVRGIWTGTRLVTRTGNEIHAPAWFTASFPPFALDGELWRRHDDFAFIQATVLDAVPSENWSEITYHIFEVPSASGNFLSRLDTARTWFDAHPAVHVQIISQTVCAGPDHLQTFLESVVARGGEGVVIRHPAMAPHAGLSPYVLKVKPFTEMEGVVIGHTPGRGQFSGMTGSLIVKLQNGVTFRIGSGLTRSQRLSPPPVGAVVVFKFHGVTKNGIPRFASLLRERRD